MYIAFGLYNKLIISLLLLASSMIYDTVRKLAIVLALEYSEQCQLAIIGQCKLSDRGKDCAVVSQERNHRHWIPKSFNELATFSFSEAFSNTTRECPFTSRANSWYSHSRLSTGLIMCANTTPEFRGPSTYQQVSITVLEPRHSREPS